MNEIRIIIYGRLRQDEKGLCSVLGLVFTAVANYVVSRLKFIDERRGRTAAVLGRCFFQVGTLFSLSSLLSLRQTAPAATPRFFGCPSEFTSHFLANFML